jgi:hypothetical protein
VSGAASGRVPTGMYGRVPTGMYVLRSAVKNPRPNRAHKHDWTKDPVWEPGVKYAVVDLILNRDRLQFICRLGQFSTIRVNLDSDQGRALFSALEKAEPTTVGDVTRLSEAMGRGIRAWEILQYLVDCGDLSVARVQELEEFLYRREIPSDDAMTLAAALNKGGVSLDPTGVSVVCGSLPAGVALSGGGWHAHDSGTGRTARYDGDLCTWSDVS